MDLNQHYERLWYDSITSVSRGSIVIDDKIDSPEDTRYGITLLTRPNSKILNLIEDFCKELRLIDPNQYYYPGSDIHMTISSIISCYEGFTLSKIAKEDYIEIIKKVCSDTPKLEIEYSGITLSTSAILIRGFPVGDSLQRLRNQLREAFLESGLEQSIDLRYKLITAHLTVVRFANPLLNPSAYLEKLREYREFHFGHSNIKNLELVYNDWYQKSSKVKLLQAFFLSE